jgi:N-acetylglucosaminyldiphosphoundecaprenol N-acetyl-beta-D-mannosaminyltransferase
MNKIITLNENDRSNQQGNAPEVTQKVRVLNGFFDRVTLQETVDWATQWIQSGYRGYICTVNVAILMMMRANPRLQKFVERAALVVADGQPIVWTSHWLSQGLPERVTGIDLIDALAERAEREKFRIYLLGASREVIEQTAKNLKKQHPQLEICGINDGYFSPSQVAERVRHIRQSGAQILLVGMGVPRQEFFLEENWSELGVNLAIGVGGSFEVIAGKKLRAPRWVQETGFEWFYRLLQEPKRLWKRYLLTNLQFIVHLLLCIIFSGKKDRNSQLTEKASL